MGQYFACVGLLIIVGLVVIIFFRKSLIGKKVKSFYQHQQFLDVQHLPDEINAFFEDEELKPKQGVLIINNRTISFYWIESYTKQTFYIIETNKPALLHYLTVVFPPGSVSQNFIQQTINAADPKLGLIKWDTESVVQASVLSDGSFAVKWRNLETTENYEKKLAWLMANVS